MAAANGHNSLALRSVSITSGMCWRTTQPTPASGRPSGVPRATAASIPSSSGQVSSMAEHGHRWPAAPSG